MLEKKPMSVTDIFDPDIHFATFSHKDFCYVEISAVLYDGTMVEAEGTAKRDSIDDPDLQIGTSLALGKALERLAHKILKPAKTEVAHRDHMREYREMQSQRAPYKPKKLKKGGKK